MARKIIAAGVFILVGLAAMLTWQELQFADGKLHVVFCDVGQGDAIFIRTPNRKDILLDGGPGKKVLDCLSHHMPFWDKRLELVILSHPHQDHFAGLIDVIKVYSILSFVTENLSNESDSFAYFQKQLVEKAIQARFVYTADGIKTNDGVGLRVLAPSQRFLKETSPRGLIGGSGEFGSLILLLSYGEFDLLLTSDAQASQLADATSLIASSIDVLQVPHHGSKTGIEKETVSQLAPKLAVISVGKGNRYRHPHEETMKILRDKDIKIIRTDHTGEIEVVSDGREWWVL